MPGLSIADCSESMPPSLVQVAPLTVSIFADCAEEPLLPEDGPGELHLTAGRGRLEGEAWDIEES